MKAISLWQPWASLMAIGHKIIETRSWYTGYRGPLAIHAAKRVFIPPDPEFVKALEELQINCFDLPRGAIVGTCYLTACVRVEDFPALLNIATVHSSSSEKARKIEKIKKQKIFGDCSPGRFLWLISDAKKLETPIPWRGHQGFFEVEI